MYRFRLAKDVAASSGGKGERIRSRWAAGCMNSDNGGAYRVGPAMGYIASGRLLEPAQGARVCSLPV